MRVSQVLLFLTVLLLIVSSCNRRPSKVSIEFSSVPIKNTTDRTWEEGWLTVSENRKESNSNEIKLPFIISKVNKERLTKTPVLVMSGGPGNGSLNMANGIVYNEWALDRDVILFEQRGTKLALPYLKCPEVDSVRIDALKNMITGSRLDSIKLIGVQMCYTRLSKKHDLAGYNTLQSVEDIEDLRKTLEVEKLILYGMSYSCNLMLTYAQKYPNRVESLILDSPLPHWVSYDEDALSNIDNTLKTLIVDKTGNTWLYDRWTKYMERIIDSTFQIGLNNNYYTYSRNDLIDVVTNLMSSHSDLDKVPQVIEEIMEGNHEMVRDVIDSNLGYTGKALGMRYSVWMSEEIPEVDKQQLRNQESAIKWLDGYPAMDVNNSMMNIWKVRSIYEYENWPADKFNGPSLVLSGKYDPWTPVSYGKLMIDYLPNGKHAIFDMKTHLVGFSNEGADKITDFINSLND